MRWVLLLVLAAGCGIGHKEPAWPKDRVVEEGTDGGESIAPRTSAAVVASKAADDDDDDAKPAAKPAADATDKADADKPTADKPATSVTAPEEVINLDDIIIEVDD